MRVAFYAPLKPPDSPVPSGDRQIARLLIKALERGGHEVTLLSRFRAFETGDDPARRDRLEGIGKALAIRYVRHLSALPADRRPQAMFTYHVYDRAPDWLGPAVARALAIPYLICEASLNPARADGANAAGHGAARDAVAAADAIVELNRADREAIAGALRPGTDIIELPPFIDTAAVVPGLAQRNEAGPLKRALADEYGTDSTVPWLLAVAMMRRGDKLKSYHVLANALERLPHKSWRLLVAGDGDARGAVERALASLPEGHVLLLGRQEGDALSRLYQAADIFVWPAVNEALGMAILEAQAAGMPVVAGQHGAVGQIVEDGVTGLLVPERDDARFAAALGVLLDDPARVSAMGRAAWDRVRSRHDIAGAARVLDDALANAVLKTRLNPGLTPEAADGERRMGNVTPGAPLTKRAIL